MKPFDQARRVERGIHLMYDVDSHPSETLLNDYVLGILKDPDADSLEKHLSECDECSAIAQELQPRDSLIDLLASAEASSFDRYSGTAATMATLNSSRVSTSMCGTVLADQTLDTSDDEPIPTPLLNHSRYRVLRMLGRGGMGCVWLAEHLVLRRQVALKMLRVDWMAKPSTIERFDREIRAAARLNHPNVASVYDAEQIGGSHFLVMEYVEGETLSELLRNGPMPVAEACRAIRDAAKGLAHAHAARLIHRDVKPGNIIRTPTGDAKILDFGLVVSPEETTSLTGPSMVMGTPDYISPEQAEDPHAADERSDIYSLGCTFYHLLAGKAPFAGGSVLQKLDAHRTKTPDEIPDVPPVVRSIAAKMMHRNPAERFQNAIEIVRALSDVLCGTVSHEPATSDLQSDVNCQTVSHFRSSWKRLVMISGMLTAILVAALYSIQTSSGELLIDTKVDDVNVVVKQQGKVVVVIDTKTNKRWRLEAGIYELDLKKNSDTIDDSDLIIDKTTVELKRNDVVVATVRKRSPITDSAPSNSAASYSTPDGSVKFALLTPSTLGDGTADSYSVKADVLRIDAMQSPKNIWLNFAFAPGHEMRVRSRFRMMQSDEPHFLKVAFLSFADNNEHNVEIRRTGNKAVVRMNHWQSQKKVLTLDSDPLTLDDEVWATLDVHLTSTKLEVSVNDAIVLECAVTVSGPRYPAIAANSCIVELQSPQAVIGK